MRLQEIENRQAFVEPLLELWEESVRATHIFLSEEDIARIRPWVEKGLLDVERLWGGYEDNEEPLGFMGVEGEKLEMLFLHPTAFGKGYGKTMVLHAIRHHHVCSVDVNEQNPQAVGFYQHLGFVQENRSAWDSLGLPFPILHFRYPFP